MIKSAIKYYPFGMTMPGRSYNSSSYRFGFNGMEKDDEIVGTGNSLNYKYRMHDPRLGRFFAVDPLAAKYPYNSPYAFIENRVIDAVELEGLEKYQVNQQFPLSSTQPTTTVTQTAPATGNNAQVTVTHGNAYCNRTETDKFRPDAPIPRTPTTTNTTFTETITQPQ